MPLAASAITSMRSSGEASSPATSGTRSRVHAVAGPGSSNVAVDEAPVERGVVGDGLGPERGQRAPALGGRGRGRVGLAEPVGELERLARSRQALRRISSSPLSASASVASICSTLRPGRSVRVLTRWGASGTGRRMSKREPAGLAGVMAPARSTARASSAAGGPACW